MDLAGIVAGLDASQREAVLTDAAPLCILAGAGSGKTRVLTRRIARRVLDGSAHGSHVLALTFTRRAARELVSRLGALGLRDRPTAGTFHAVAHAALRTRWDEQRRRPPELLTSRPRLVATVVDEAGRRARGANPLAVAAEIDWARARLVPPDRYEPEARRAARRPGGLDLGLVAELYTAYEDAKRARKVIDFDDLLALCAREIQRDAPFAEVQRWRFRHLFVDEFQDLNPLQHALLEAWRGNRPDLCVVGDPNQAIYGWNGADAGWLLHFADHHPGATIVRLGASYRSTPQVLGAAHAVLATLPDAAATPAAVRPDGPRPTVHAFNTDDDEAVGIARLLRDARIPGRPWSSSAVLVRTNAQIGPVERALRHAGIPCRARETATLLDEPVVRSVVLDVTVEGDRAGTLAALVDEVETRLLASEDGPPVPPVLRHVASLASMQLELDPSATIGAFRAWLVGGGAGDDDPWGDGVDVLTFHAAKGLEWPVVVVAGFEKGLVPHAGATNGEARAEEVRLCYVALTRAEHTLHVTWARHRGGAPRSPSPLLDALEAAVAPLPPSAPPPSLPHAPPRTDPVLDALRAWRRGAARAAEVPEPVVCDDRTLAALAAARPATEADVAAVLGPLAARRVAPAIVAAVARALDPTPAVPAGS